MRAPFTVAVLVIGALAAAATRDVEERNLRQAMAYAQRGLSSFQKGNTARAREDFDRALEKMPNLPDAHVGLGHLAMRERRFEDALSEYRLADTGSKELGSLLESLQSDRFAKSRDELERLRAEHVMLVQEASRNEMRGGEEVPTNSGLNAGQVERGRAEVESRIRNLETMKPPAPATREDVPADVLFFEGNALFNLERTDEAIAVWENAAGRMREYAPIHNNLAVAYWTAGRLADAKASLKRAEELGFKVNPRFKADLEKTGTVSVEPKIPAPAGVMP